MSAVHLRSWATTNSGPKRKHNEDAYVDRPDLGVWAVADGAGGHHAGEVASGMIRESLEAIPSGLSASELLSEVRTRIEMTHEALRAEAQRRGPDVIIASTVVVMLARNDHFACLWAGDSRAYLLRDGALQQISPCLLRCSYRWQDHSRDEFARQLRPSGARLPLDGIL